MNHSSLDERLIGLRVCAYLQRVQSTSKVKALMTWVIIGNSQPCGPVRIDNPGHVGAHLRGAERDAALIALGSELERTGDG